MSMAITVSGGFGPPCCRFSPFEVAESGFETGETGSTQRARIQAVEVGGIGTDVGDVKCQDRSANVGKTIVNHPFGNGLYKLFMVIWGMVDGLLLFYPHYIHTYIHTYVHTYIHTYIHNYIPTYLPTYIHTYIQTYIHTYTDKHTYIHRQTDTQTHRHTDIQTYRHTDIQTYRHTDIHTYIHTYTDTQTHRHTYIHI